MRLVNKIVQNERTVCILLVDRVYFVERKQRVWRARFCIRGDVALGGREAERAQAGAKLCYFDFAFARFVEMSESRT